MHIYTQAFQEALSRFESSLRDKDASQHTIDGYGSDVRLFAKWFAQRQPDGCAVREAEAADVRAYRDHLVDVKRRRPSTINRHLLSLRKFYAFASSGGLRRDNPATDVRCVRTVKRMRPLGLRPAEVQRLLVAAGKSPHGQGARNYAIVQLMLQTGLRVDEVVQLVGADLEINDRSGLVRVRSGKGSKERSVPLNAAGRRALSRFFEVRDRPGPREPIFLSTRGGRLARRSIQHVVESCASRARIDRISTGAHTLRHTFALNFLGANPGDIVGLAALMGHETIETTAVYLRVSAAELAERIERIVD